KCSVIAFCRKMFPPVAYQAIYLKMLFYLVPKRRYSHLIQSGAGGCTALGDNSDIRVVFHELENRLSDRSQKFLTITVITFNGIMYHAALFIPITEGKVVK